VTKLGVFLGLKKLILGQNKTNYGKKGDLLGQEKSIFGQYIKMNFGIKLGHFGVMER
jgi:hypothetical protein